MPDQGQLVFAQPALRIHTEALADQLIALQAAELGRARDQGAQRAARDHGGRGLAPVEHADGAEEPAGLGPGAGGLCTLGA